ncbi:MAG: EMC3/TMCO1 family protein [Nanoarchaeota archaeon]
MNTEGKEGGFMGIFIVMIVSLALASLWDKVSFIKEGAHAILNPTAGVLLNWNITIGMSAIVLIISFFMTIIQKYATDQKILREMKEEQKILQEEMKKYKNHPEKVAELSRKQLEFIPKTMKLTMRPIVYTAIPLILFFRWFMDFFALMEGFRFFGIFSWFWFYLIGTMIFSSILRKMMKVV